ncbi:MAG: alpha-glucan family phosphorylase [Planctomycetota bacterium]|nr:alpha-glucan family phosphorylase [Planctomycetota bacterium]
MNKLRTYTVVPALPEQLKRLRELSYNLWWSWHPDALEMFRRLDVELWNDVVQNPVRFLTHVAQKRLDQAASDDAYLAHMNRVLQAFDSYMTSETWFSRKHAEFVDSRIAYFSMEFGLHESLPIYSGGLGVLAGDHLKSASDLGVPLVAMGMLYRQGYFQQRLTNDGWQLEEYHAIDVSAAPLMPVVRPDGERLTVEIPIGPRSVTLQAWKTQVGRVSLYLLDAEVSANDPHDREITCRLYAGDDEMRIRQEVALGIGGFRMLEKLGISAAVFHMNEGHSAFLAVERIRQRMEVESLTFAEAREAIVPSNVFTTHTPVPAGIDSFKPELLHKYLDPYLPAIGMSPKDFMALGRRDASNIDEPFSMAVLALRLAGASNGVSALHGHVSREMWHSVWPGAPRDEVPLTSITNGIHINSWMSPEMSDLLHRYLGPKWAEDPVNHDAWLQVDEIPDLELWRTHEKCRVELVAYTRKRIKEQFRRRGAPPAEIKSAGELLDPEALTIGFARRFAPYKRGALIFRDPERLKSMVAHPERPVQFIFAGKAHPRDARGKEIVKQILTFAKLPEFRRRIVFLENYDISVARRLVQGVDVWLNNPIKPREASGTSGMKVPPNGGINLSVLDGWWPEAYDGENGWAVGDGQIYEDPDYQDYVEGEAIYDLLEKEIIPAFYDRGPDGLPRRWIARMKASMRTICPMFNSNRMLEEYTNRLYVPAARRWRHMSKDNFAATKALARWKHELIAHWSEVRVEHVEAEDPGELPVGAYLGVKARVHLGRVSPDEVAVELYHGRVDPSGQLVEGRSEPMTLSEKLENGSSAFIGRIPCVQSGQHQFAVRILPQHPDLAHRFDTGLILWG